MKRLLYVEDDPINAFVIKKLLAQHYTTEHVEDGETCLSILGDGAFRDLVLMDINLGRGKMDGIETMKKIKATPLFENLPVVAITSYAMPGDKERFLGEGFNGYLSKPVERPVLLDYLGNLSTIMLIDLRSDTVTLSYSRHARSNDERTDRRRCFW
ncbi:MAG: response regulator [Bacteroidota bacterium]